MDVEGKHNDPNRIIQRFGNMHKGEILMSEARKIETDEELDDLQEVAILDDASAEMVLQQVRRAEEQYKKMEAWYDFQKSKAREIYENTMAWAEGCLRGYMDMVPTKNTKTQRKYELPSGTLMLKRQEPTFEQQDAELLPWLKKNHPDLVKVKESSNWAELKKLLKVTPDGTGMATEDGEIVPGITVTQREAKFVITVK